MKKTNLLRNGILFSTLFMFAMSLASAQMILYQENFGTPSDNTLIQNYTGWQDTSALYTGNGTCDIRSSNASTGYGTASGGGNVMINDTVKWFQISRLNTLGDTNVSLYCGLRKTTTENGGNFVVEVSADSLSWTRLNLQDTLPAGTGTGHWYRVRYPNVPSCANLHIRFSNLKKVDYRLDDVSLVVGEENVLETVATPSFSPAGGTYYEPQTISITTSTPDAILYYTLDGSTPDTYANHYVGPITVNSSATVKVIACKTGMYNSEIATETYVIIDTNSLVVLPFDISTNSEIEHQDITLMDGFRAYHLGTSYADGSAKFEATQAGEAMLTAHLDSSPGKLSFDLKGRKGGSTPAAYQDINLLVSQSADGQNWTSIATLSENDISVDDYTRFDNYSLQPGTRYIRWLLLAATKGNTQLNNIKITQYDGSDTMNILDYNLQNFCLYPNPTSDRVNFYQGSFDVLSMTLYDLCGRELRNWTGQCPSFISIADLESGTYLLTIRTTAGIMNKKLVRY